MIRQVELLESQGKRIIDFGSPLASFLCATPVVTDTRPLPSRMTTRYSETMKSRNPLMLSLTKYRLESVKESPESFGENPGQGNTGSLKMSGNDRK